LRDFELLKSARAEAFSLVKEDPSLLFPAHEVYRRIIENKATPREP